MVIGSWVGAQGIGKVLKLLHHLGLNLATLMHTPLHAHQAGMHSRKKICRRIENMHVTQE
jgi:hypothetical protein